VAILGAIGTLGYVIATPKVGERFTEVYVLGLESKAIDYPRELKVGEEGRVIVSIILLETDSLSFIVFTKGVESSRYFVSMSDVPLHSTLGSKYRMI